ncbi:hypothetical protein R69927_05825 [Paraburkholderia domus]|uniref:hypothetical protein n=1 Tax=Paraburkholderia domus TaxID=2793075 RepID=UPI001912002F|nr:hypothetical protein [Paraburkholderia domus]MBK5090543.1 hypothetical protein [Burkholderia sp. R-69927]CAE6908215.1 hypothetical protein R69927_05825 [Paraburkholderia domus]
MVAKDPEEIAAGASAARTFLEEIERIVKTGLGDDGGEFAITAIVNLLESDQFASDLRLRRGFALVIADALGSAVERGLDSSMLNPQKRSNALANSSQGQESALADLDRPRVQGKVSCRMC